MRKPFHGLMLATLFGLSAAVTLAAGTPTLASLTAQERSSGLKAALNQAADVAIRKLGVTDGFLGNPDVRIPLPGKLQKAQKLLKTVGLGAEAEALVTTMNRAAEAAVPEARTLLVEAVKQMSVADAAAILTGPPDAATQYFRRTSAEKLTARFLPIVQKATAKTGVAARYNKLGSKALQYNLIDAQDANIDSYVTQKTLDGLFLTMAREEAAIRKDPLGQSSKLLQRVFGALAQ